METKNVQVAAERAARGRAGAQQQNPAKVGFAEIDNVRSYMFDIETKEVLHIDRLGADDVARAIEKLAEISIVGTRHMWIWVSKDALTLKLTENWRVKIMRDGAVVIKVTDHALIGDDKFILLSAAEGGRFVPVAKGETITWDGTEEYFSPSDILKLAKEVAKQILEQTHWL
jgi:hypothetical protein